WKRLQMKKGPENIFLTPIEHVLHLDPTHSFNELIKEISSIVWTGTCLGVILNREYIFIFHLQASDRIIINTEVGDLYICVGFCFLPVYRETMILRSNLSFSCFQIKNGVIYPPVSMMHFIS